jgi:hypothetical protein
LVSIGHTVDENGIWWLGPIIIPFIGLWRHDFRLYIRLI